MEERREREQREQLSRMKGERGNGEAPFEERGPTRLQHLDETLREDTSV